MSISGKLYSSIIWSGQDQVLLSQADNICNACMTEPSGNVKLSDCFMRVLTFDISAD